MRKIVWFGLLAALGLGAASIAAACGMGAMKSGGMGNHAAMHAMHGMDHGSQHQHAATEPQKEEGQDKQAQAAEHSHDHQHMAEADAR